MVKKAGITFGVKFAKTMVQKIPGKVLTKINQKVGFRFLTKFGTKGIINIGKTVPVVGAVVGGGFDLVETKLIANRAMKMFFDEDFSVGNDDNEDMIESVSIEESNIDEELLNAYVSDDETQKGSSLWSDNDQ